MMPLSSNITSRHEWPAKYFHGLLLPAVSDYALLNIDQIAYRIERYPSATAVIRKRLRFSWDLLRGVAAQAS